MFLQQRLTNFYLGSVDKFFKSWIARVFSLAALQICCSRHYSCPLLTRLYSRFNTRLLLHFFFCASVGIFAIALFFFKG